MTVGGIKRRHVDCRASYDTLHLISVINMYAVLAELLSHPRSQALSNEDGTMLARHTAKREVNTLTSAIATLSDK